MRRARRADINRSTTRGSNGGKSNRGDTPILKRKSPLTHANGEAAWRDALPDHSHSLPPIHTRSKLMHMSTDDFARTVNNIMAGKEFVTG